MGGGDYGSAKRGRFLSRPLSSFVGRSEAIDQVSALLDRGRLVTVTGPGGVGKTRLAAEVLARLPDQFADGVWAVELAAVREPELVPAVVVSALGVRVTAETTAIDALAAHLAPRQLLLVLDNCEHVLDAAAELCGELLPAADDIKILATSREPLGLAGEARYRLAPLSLPGDGERDGGVAEAVALFVDRARQAGPDVDLDGEARPLVERLVRRLDGMPLAIELAAARVEALGLVQLAGRLEDSFRLLVSASRVPAARQRSLEATVDWSYRLLSEPERRVFRLLSVFPAPFTLEAAEAVAGADAELAVLRLVDCSLLVPPRQGADGRSRYQMLETLRAFAQSSLTVAGEEEDVAKALAAYALDVAERAGRQLETACQELPAAAWLDAEYPMLRQGLAWALHRDPAAALRIAVGLGPWWRLRGRWAEGYAQLRPAVDMAEQGTAGWYAGHFWLARMGGSSTVSHRHYSLIVDGLRDGPPSAELIDAIGFRAGTLRNTGRLAEGAAEARAALGLARQIGYAAGEANALVQLSLQGLFENRGEDAVAWARQAQQVDFTQLSGWRARETQWILPWVLVHTDHVDGAREACEAVLALSRAAGDLGRQADMLWLLAQLARQAGQLPEAGAFLSATAEIAPQAGGDVVVLLNILEEGALECAAAGRYAEAVTLWSALFPQLAAAGFFDTDLDQQRREPLMRSARQALNAPRLRAAERRGAAMTLTAAVEFAVLMTGPDAPALDPPAPPTVTATAAPGARLSARERELVALVAQGHTDAEISAKLFISIRTVRSHLDRIRDKSGYRRRADLTRLALLEGIV